MDAQDAQDPASAGVLLAPISVRISCKSRDMKRSGLIKSGPFRYRQVMLSLSFLLRVAFIPYPWTSQVYCAVC